MIAMADGTSEPIERIRPGELVRAYDPTSGSFVATPAIDVLRHGPERSSDGIVVINGRLHATTNHPIWVDGQRMRADHLDVGSVILVRSEDRSSDVHRETVQSLELVPGGVPTFDLRVGDPGTFVADGIVVFIKTP
jgi:hypothetical protein